jgi:hypothetical protein
MILPDDYLRRGRRRACGGRLFVLDCIASGTIWVDMAGLRRRRAGQRAAEGLERLALLRLVMLSDWRASASTPPPAAALPAI